MQLNDQVKPHADFNFVTYHGPADLEDEGIVVKVYGDGWVDVQWTSSGEVSDHEDGTIEGRDTDCAVILA